MIGCRCISGRQAPPYQPVRKDSSQCRLSPYDQPMTTIYPQPTPASLVFTFLSTPPNSYSDTNYYWLSKPKASALCDVIGPILEDERSYWLILRPISLADPADDLIGRSNGRSYWPIQQTILLANISKSFGILLAVTYKSFSVTC